MAMRMFQSLKAHYIRTPEVVTLEAVTIQIILHNRQKLRVTASYKQPTKLLQTDDFKTLFNSDSPTLLIVHLNSKNLAWRCRAGNPNRSRLYEILNTPGIQISEPPEPTFF